MKFEDVITQVKFKYWKSENDSSFNEFKDWYQFDTQKYGRCFTLQPSEEHTQLGIRVIELRLRSSSSIFIHDKGGMFYSGAKQYMELCRQYDFSFNWEYYDLIDYGGDLCKKDKEYSQYFCIDSAVQEELLGRFGCTTPFVSNKSKICSNEDEGKIIVEIISELYGNFPLIFGNFRS